MKKFLLSLVSLLVLAIGNLWADEAYYTLDTTGSTKTDNNGYATTGTATVDGIEWVFEGNGTINPWRLGGKNLTEQDRVVYTKTSMDVAISSVKLTVGNASSITVNSLKLIVASDAGFEDVIDEVSKDFEANSDITFEPTAPATSWAADAYYKFVFNVSVSGNSNKFVEFKTVEFFKDAGSEAPAVAKPVITPSTGTYFGTQTVVITAEEGADIFYTLNGGGETAYTAPFEVNETTVVVAYAKKGEAKSGDATSTITLGPSYTTFAAANAAAVSDKVQSQLSFSNALVVYVNGQNAYLRDETGGFLVYGTNTLKAGDRLSGTITGQLFSYNGLPELQNPVFDIEVISSDNEIAPVEVDAADLAANPLNYVSQYIVVKPATFAANAEVSTKTNVNFTVGETALILRNNFTITFSVEAAKTYSVAGFVCIYNENIQVYPVAAADIKVYVPVYIQNADFSSAEGWTPVASDSYKDLGMYQIGGEQMVRFAAPTVDETHLNTEYASGFECRWNTNFASYTQTTAEIPAGDYVLVYDVENVNGGTTKAAYENRFTVTVGETVYTDDFTEWMNGKSAWTTHGIPFTLAEAQTVTISLGYGTGSNNIGADNTPAIYVSHLKLVTAEEYEAIKLDVARKKKAAELEALSRGDNLFQYSDAAVLDAIAALAAAKTVEEIEAVKAVQNLPDTEKLYSFQLKDGGNYMVIDNGIKLAAKAKGFSFVPDNGGGYALKDGDSYVACTGTGKDIWTMSATAEPYSWTIAALADGYYTIAKASAPTEHIGVDNTDAGSSCYADKGVSDKALWAIAEYVAPTVYTVAISESIENGTVAAEPASAEAGEKIQLTATPAEGYELEGYIVTCETINEVVVVAEDGSFTMPADNVTVSATFVEAGPAPVVWEAYPGWVRDNVASAYYFGVITPGTASEAFAMSGFQLAQESGAGAAERYAVIATAAPEGTTLSADKVLAVSENPVTPTVANPGKNYDYTFSEDIILKGATTYYVVFTTANEPVDGNYTVGAQRLSLNVSYGEYAPGLVAGNGTAQKNWTPGFKAQLTIPAFAISCAEVENGKIETSVAEARVGEKVTVTATPAEGYKLKKIIVTGKTTDIVVEVEEDGSFIMPADEVTVSATFQDLASVVYIETDLTSQFAALTNASNWKTGAGGAAAYTSTDFCPMVTPNGLSPVQVCEFYEATCNREGDLLYQTVTGLSEGTYKIELYGGAAFTFGRGFGSQAFTGETGTGDAWGTHVSDTYTAGQHIDTETGVKLYAVTSEGEFGGEIPIYYATNFPDGAAVVTLNDVKVGADGAIRIGMSKTSHSTNWHVIQLKGVTATVDAASLLAHTVKDARNIDPATVPAALATEISEVIVANDKEYETADEYKHAIAVIDAVIAKAAPYAPLTEVLKLGETYKANSSNEDAKNTYDATIAAVKAAYDAVTVEDFAAAIATVNEALPALAKSQTADNSDMSILLEGLAWTVNAGNGPNPYADCTETFAETNIPAGKVMYQSLTGLNPGKYEVKMLACANVAWRDCNTGEGIAQVYVNDVTEDIEVIAQTACTPADHEYTLIAIVGEDGTLEFGLQNIAEGGNWYVAKPTSVKLVKALYGTELAYEKALASIEDGKTYRVFTEVNENRFYLNNAGYLVADVKKAATFTFAKVQASGTVYETGINLGCKFTNPNTGGKTTFTNEGHILTGSNDRNDWERQVFFLKDGKYAVRATNANNEAWGSNTYWDVLNTEAALPEAGYVLAPSYVWQIEANVDNRPEAFAKTQTWAAKLQAIEGLVTNADQWYSNAKQSSEGSYEALTDGDYTTFFHSQYDGENPNAYHYLQATLSEPVQDFYFYMKKRSQNQNNRPTDIVITASNDGESFADVTEINEGLPTTSNVLDYFSGKISMDQAYSQIRFTVTATNTNAKFGDYVFFTASEWYILPSNEMTDAARQYMVGDFTDLADEDVETINTIDAQIEAAYQQFLLKEDLADLVAYVEHAKEYVAAYPAADADELVQDATTTLERLGNGEYTTKEEIASAKSSAILTVQLFVTAAGTPTADIDITEWFVVNPTPTTNGDGWTITNASGAPAAANAYDPVNNNAEFWNQLGYTIAQTVVLPAGEYKLTAVAYTRTAGTANGYTFDDMNAVLKAGDAQMTIALLSPTEVNGRAAGKTKMDEGLCDNELKFVVAETGEIVISLTSDPTQNDAWTVWRSFKIERLAPPAVVLNAPSWNIEEGTQAQPNMLAVDETLQIIYTADNLEVCGYNADDLKVKVTVMLSGDLPENIMNMQSETVHRVLGETFYIDLGTTDFPVELKAGYVYQNIVITAAQLVVPATEETEEKVVAIYAGNPAQLHWIGKAAGPASVDYAGVIEQTVVNRQTGEQMGETTTAEKTITLIDAGEGFVDIKVNGGITMPIGMPVPEFTIEGVTVEESQDGSATYSYEGSVSIQNVMMTMTYGVTLTGYQASVEATPVFCVVLSQSLVDTIYFGADQAAIDAYKQTVGINDVKDAKNVGTIYDLSGRKVEKMVKGGVYIVNGKKVSFK